MSTAWLAIGTALRGCGRPQVWLYLCCWLQQQQPLAHLTFPHLLYCSPPPAPSFTPAVSKGVLGECGLRGGYVELTNFHPGTVDELYKVGGGGVKGAVSA